MGPGLSKQARKLQATLDGCNPKLRPPTDLLTGVKCRATYIYLDLLGRYSKEHRVDPGKGY